MKELEKLGSKRGVVQQTVEEVVKSLVDDRLVECEKIGSGNFYWAFPSKSFIVVSGPCHNNETVVLCFRRLPGTCDSSQLLPPRLTYICIGPPRLQ